MTAATPAAVVPCFESWTPSSLTIISAERLSLDVSIDARMSFIGGDVTDATSAASAGAVPCDAPPICTPRDSSNPVSTWAALRAGSSASDLRATFARPSFTVSAPIGPMSPPVRYSGFHVGM